VYFALRDENSATKPHPVGLSTVDAATGIRIAHAHGASALVALDTYAQPEAEASSTSAIDTAAELGADAIMLSDLGLLDYAAQKYPALPLHLSVQASVTNYESLEFYRKNFGVRRAVLPRVLSLAQIEAIVRNTAVEIEVFGFGTLCVMVGGHCALSGYVTGTSPNTRGCCSPGASVSWEHTREGLASRVNGVLVDRYGEQEHPPYPTLCKGRYNVAGQTYHALEEPASLNVLELVPTLARMGVRAVLIEGRDHNAAYVAEVTRIWREAINCAQRDGSHYELLPSWAQALRRLAQGEQQTFGSYYRPWRPT
jgi:putative protease